MKILPQKMSRKKVFTTCAAIAVVFLGVTAFAYHYQTWPFHTDNNPSTINLTPATSDQKKAGEATKQNSLESSKQNLSGSDQPPAPTPQPGSSKSSVEVTITAANQNNATLQIRTLISAVVNDGSCTLTLANNSGKNLTYTASVQPLSTTSTCKGFDIPTSDLSPGSWSMTVVYNNDTLTGSASKTITIK